MKQGVWRLKNTSAPDRWFYFCPDAPHGLKRFRDHCLDKGYILPKNPYDKRFAWPNQGNIHELLKSGDWVEWGKPHFQEILNADSAEFKINWKLKEHHLEATQAARCSVRVAAQTMSALTAAAMTFLKPEWSCQSGLHKLRMMNG